jgi:integrase/recombinase XerC
MPLTEQFLHYLIYEKRFSEHTVTAYKKDLENFTAILALGTDAELAEVTHRDIRSFIVALVDSGLENSSVNRKLSSIKTFYRYLRQQGLCETNPALKVKSLKQKSRLPQFVPETQLWDASVFEEETDPFQQSMDRLIMELFYQTGIRLSELINLKENDVSGSQIKVLGKRNKERIIPVSKDLAALVDGYLEKKYALHLPTEFLFMSKSGKKLAPKFVYGKVNYYLGKVTNLGKKSPHVLRHTFATHMLNNGATLESIKKLLGHVDLTATQIYTHNSFRQIKTIYNQSHPRGGAD